MVVDVLTVVGVGDCVAVASGMDSMLVDVCKGLETVTVVGVGVGECVGVVGFGIVGVGVLDCVGGVVGFDLDAEVVDLTNVLEIVFGVDVNDLGSVGVDVDDGLIGSLDMDAYASWADCEDFVCCSFLLIMLWLIACSKRGATIFLRFNTSGPVFFSIGFLPNAPFAFG